MSEMSRATSKILKPFERRRRGCTRQVMDQVTLREFDRLGLPPVKPLRPEDIRKIRETSQVSQAVFVVLLTTSVMTVQKWEMGQNAPPARRSSCCIWFSADWRSLRLNLRRCPAERACRARIDH